MEVNDLHSFLHFVQFPELDALRKVRDSNPRNSIRVSTTLSFWRENLIRFPLHFSVSQYLTLQLHNKTQLLLIQLFSFKEPIFSVTFLAQF